MIWTKKMFCGPMPLEKNPLNNSLNWIITFIQQWPSNDSKQKQNFNQLILIFSCQSFDQIIIFTFFFSLEFRKKKNPSYSIIYPVDIIYFHLYFTKLIINNETRKKENKKKQKKHTSNFIWKPRKFSCLDKFY